jgi:hypothetical protein
MITQKQTEHEQPLTLLPEEPTAVPRLERLTGQGLIVIRVDGEVLMSFEETDTVQDKYSAVLAARNQWGRQREIAKAWGVSRRSVVKWVGQYRRAGLAGFQRPSGRPPMVTEPMKRGIMQLREQRVGIDEISTRFGISRGSVCEVLYGRRRLVVTPELPNRAEPDSVTAEQQEGGVVSEQPGEVEKPRVAPESAAVAVETSASVEAVAVAPEAKEAVALCAEADAAVTPMPEPMAASSDEENPLDRKGDRLAAYLGLIEEATPLFAEHESVEGLGSFLALALFLRGSFLSYVKRVFVTLGPAFYGLRSVFITLFLMAVQRIRNPERLDCYSPLRLGRLLGLDRSPSVKTLRAKLKALAQRKQASNLMNLVARDLVAGEELPQAVLYVDGHVQCYYGKGKVGQVFSTSKHRVIKGSTDYWVNRPDGTPLLCLPVAFNEPLNRRLPAIVLQAQKVCGHRKLTVVFDRGGAEAATYEWLIQAGCDFIAYHKHPAPVDFSVFQKKDVQINGRLYAYAPYEREVALNVYQGQGRRRRDTGRVVRLREIILRRADEGTTHVISTLRGVASEDLAGCLFKRWTQENFFKYMLATYELDHLYTYAKPPVPAGGEHPNPEYVQLQKQAGRIREQIGRILGRQLTKVAHEDVQQWVVQFTALHKGKTGQQLARLARLLADTTKVLAQTPPRESTQDYVRLDVESRLLGNLVKCAAYRAEGALARMVAEVWKGSNGNYRGIVDAFLKTSGALRVESHRLRIILRPQSTPARTRLLEHLCRRVSELSVVYPGTELRLFFEVAAR